MPSFILLPSTSYPHLSHSRLQGDAARIQQTKDSSREEDELSNSFVKRLDGSTRNSTHRDTRTRNLHRVPIPASDHHPGLTKGSKRSQPAQFYLLPSLSLPLPSSFLLHPCLTLPASLLYQSIYEVVCAQCGRWRETFRSRGAGFWWLGPAYRSG